MLVNKSMWRLFGFASIIGCLLLFNAGCATNADVNRLGNRLDGLENRSRAIEERLDKQITQLNALIEKRKEQDNRLQNLYAGQDAEFYQLKNEVRELSGRVEETGHYASREAKEMRTDLDENREKLASLSEAVELNDKRISRLATYLGIDSGEKITAAVSESSSDGKETPSEDLPEDKLYGFAKKSFDQENFETARDAFEKFIETYPDSDKADNARFWIGEVYYNEEWYEKAILEYQEVIDNYPDGNKVPAAYLKQGISFQKLGEAGNAKLVLKELIRKFPDATEADVARKILDGID